MERGPLRLFFSYAHEDADARDQLDRHLELLRRQHVIVTWNDGLIVPGEQWARVIEENMRAADLILLLISEAFLASEFVREIEIPMAMEEAERGGATVLPVLLEPVDFAGQPFHKLEVLPSKALAIAAWEDRERAFANVADGIRRAATAIVWARGGPFEFGPHAFTDAELVEFDEPTRAAVADRLHALHDRLSHAVPARRVDRNLLIATWSMRSLGRTPVTLPETRFHLAAIISAFDLVCLQEVHDDLTELNRLLAILGPDWNYLVTDVSEGSLGNRERFAILYYAPRVEFEHVSGEVVLQRGELIDGEQFARKPLVASFRAGELRFRACTAHLYFGGTDAESVARTAKEAGALARHLVRRTTRRDRTGILLCANLNLRRADSPVVEAVRAAGIELPEALLRPNLARGGGYVAGAIGFVAPDGELRLDATGVFDHDGAEQASDHLPLWAELPTTVGVRRSVE